MEQQAYESHPVDQECEMQDTEYRLLLSINWLEVN